MRAAGRDSPPGRAGCHPGKDRGSAGRPAGAAFFMPATLVVDSLPGIYDFGLFLAGLAGAVQRLSLHPLHFC